MVTRADQAVSRPALRYHGGKWKLAPWIVAHLPEHRVYTEPFGGGTDLAAPGTPFPRDGHVPFPPAGNDRGRRLRCPNRQTGARMP
ncbi:MAG TPA: hypothetical protein DD491_10160 [Halieaceae bacterium]|nr:hypothetical protein [Halieaceae bacterium]